MSNWNRTCPKPSRHVPVRSARLTTCSRCDQLSDALNIASTGARLSAALDVAQAEQARLRSQMAEERSQLAADVQNAHDAASAIESASPGECATQLAEERSHAAEAMIDEIKTTLGERERGCWLWSIAPYKGPAPSPEEQQRLLAGAASELAALRGRMRDEAEQHAARTPTPCGLLREHVNSPLSVWSSCSRARAGEAALERRVPNILSLLTHKG